MCVCVCKKCKSSPYSIVERRVPELIPVLGSQLAGDMSHEPSGRLPLLSTRPTVTLATLKRAGYYQFRCLVNRGTMGVNSLPKTVTRQRRGCDLNAGPSVPEISTLTSWLLSHTCVCVCVYFNEFLCVTVQPQTTSDSGSCSNLVTVHQSDFEVFDALASDGRAVTTDNSATTSMMMFLALA